MGKRLIVGGCGIAGKASSVFMSLVLASILCVPTNSAYALWIDDDGVGASLEGGMALVESEDESVGAGDDSHDTEESLEGAMDGMILTFDDIPLDQAKAIVTDQLGWEIKRVMDMHGDAWGTVYPDRVWRQMVVYFPEELGFETCRDNALALECVIDAEPNSLMWSCESDNVSSSYVAPVDYLGNPWWHLTQINVPLAWDISQCAGEVSVAVFDDGINFSHPDLINNIDFEHAYDMLEDSTLDSQGFRDSYQGNHGTLVSGAIAAQVNNMAGSAAGVSYNAKIIPIRVAAYDEEKKKVLPILTLL